MANVQGFADLAVFTLDAGSMLTTVKNVAYTANFDKADTGAISRVGKRRQTVKKSVTLRSGIMETLAADSSMVSSNLSVTACSLGGVNILGYLRGGTFNGSFDIREVSAVSDVFKWPQIFGKDYKVDLTLLVPAAGDTQTANFLRGSLISTAGLLDTDLADQDLTRQTFSITINGVTYALQLEIDSVDVTINQNEEKVIKISGSGNDPGTGAYPTTPTGTSTLLENCFNDFNTAVALVLTDAAAGSGVSMTGNFIFSSFNFSFNDSEVTMIDFEMQSRGTIAQATV